MSVPLVGYSQSGHVIGVSEAGLSRALQRELMNAAAAE